MFQRSRKYEPIEHQRQLHEQGIIIAIFVIAFVVIIGSTVLDILY